MRGLKESSDYLREQQKRDLRKRLIQTSFSEEQIDKQIKRHRIKKLLVFLAVIAGVVCVFFAYKKIRASFAFHSFKVKWEKEIETSTTTQYVNYGSNILKYDNAGVSYIDKTGAIVWNKSYEMHNPIVETNSDYIAVADQSYKSAVILDKSGNMASVETSYPIIKLSVSQHGVLAVISQSDDASYINFFNKDGTKLDIELKTLLDSEGYAIDVALSPSGQQMIASYVYVTSGVLKNKILFYNFKEGQVLTNQMAAGFEQDETLIPQVEFLSETEAVAFGSDKVLFYNIPENRPLQPELDKQYDFEQKINSVFYDSNYVGIVMDNSSEKSPQLLKVYNNLGEEILSKNLDMQYTKVLFSRKDIIMYNEGECEIYSISGKKRYSGSLDMSIGIIVATDKNERYIATGGTTMKSISLR